MKYFQILLFVFFAGFAACQTAPEGAALDAAAFDAKIKATENPQVLDVRTPGEYASGFISGAVNIDYNDGAFQENIGKLDKSKTYFVYCLAGSRSASAAGKMRSSGFTNVYELTGGIMAWKKAGLPVGNETAVADEISPEKYAEMTSGALVMIDFYAPWCGPCKKMEPDLQAISKEYEGKIIVHRIDVDKNKNLAVKLGITQIPVVKIFSSGKETWTNTGYVGKEDLLKAAGLAK